MTRDGKVFTDILEQVSYPVLCFSGKAWLGKYDTVAAVKLACFSSLFAVKQEGEQLILGSCGTLMSYTRLQRVPARSFWRRVTGCYPLAPADPEVRTISVSDARIKVLAVLGAWFGEDEDFDEEGSAMHQLRRNIERAPTVEALIALIPERLPPG